MSRLSPAVAATFCVLLAGSCGFLDDPGADAPDIPEDFPPLGDQDIARIEVAIDGNAFHDTGLCDHGFTLEADAVRFSLEVGGVALSVAGRDEGRYSSRADEVDASWFGADEHVSSQECGESVVRFVGEDIYDTPFGEKVAVWGTLQLVLCAAQGEGVEVSGKFSCVLDG